MSKRQSGRKMATAHKIALKLAERRGWYCHWCGKTLDKKSVTADHIIPKSKGGKNTIENIVPSCQRCNNIRGDRQDITKLEKEKKAIIRRTRPYPNSDIIVDTKGVFINLRDRTEEIGRIL